jgi:hypothetical protein
MSTTRRCSSARGRAWEAAAVAQHVVDRLKDWPLHRLDFATEVMETMDEIRRQVGTLR